MLCGRHDRTSECSVQRESDSPAMLGVHQLRPTPFQSGRKPSAMSVQSSATHQPGRVRPVLPCLEFATSRRSRSRVSRMAVSVPDPPATFPGPSERPSVPASFHWIPENTKEALRWEASILRETHHLGFLDVVVDTIWRYYRSAKSPEYLPTCLEFEHCNRIFREECLEWQRLERHGQLIGQWRWESAAASLGRMQTVANMWRLLGEQLFTPSQRQQAQHQRLSYSRETGEFTPLGVRFGNNSLEKVGSDRLGCGDDLTLADGCVSSEEMDSIMERLADYFGQPTTDIWDHYHACRDLCDVQSG